MEELALTAPEQFIKILISKIFESNSHKGIFLFASNTFVHHLNPVIPHIKREDVPYRDLIPKNAYFIHKNGDEFTFSTPTKLNGVDSDYTITASFNKEISQNEFLLSPKGGNGKPIILTSCQ